MPSEALGTGQIPAESLQLSDPADSIPSSPADSLSERSDAAQDSREQVDQNKSDKDGKMFSLDEITGDKSPSPPKKEKADKEVLLDEEGNKVEDDSVEEDEVEAKEKAAAKEDSDLPDDPIKDKDVEKDQKLHGNTERDYSGFTNRQVKLLKRLDKGRFEVIGKEWRELNGVKDKAVALAVELEQQKKLLTEGGIPAQWYEHPDAYTLSKEFRDISTQYSRITEQDTFYQQQLLAVRGGQPWHAILGYDQQGNPRYSNQMQPSDQAALQLERTLQDLSVQRGQLEGRSTALQTQFKQQHQNGATNIKAGVQSYIDRLDASLKPLPQDVEAIMKEIPAVYKDHPLAHGYGQLGAVIFQQARELKRLKDEKTQETKIAADRRLAGVTSNKTPKAPTNGTNRDGGKKMLTMSEFMRDND